MFTDDEGVRLLVENLGLEIDEVATDLNILGDRDSKWWALGKLLAPLRPPVLRSLFQANVFSLLLKERMFSPELVERMKDWRNEGREKEFPIVGIS